MLDLFILINMFLVLIVIILLANTLINYYNSNKQYKLFSILLTLTSITTIMYHYLALLINGGPNWDDTLYIWYDLYIPLSFYMILALVGLFYFFKNEKQEK